MPRFIDIIGINTSPQEQGDLLEEENLSFDELGTAYDVEQVQQLKCLDNAKTEQYLRVEPVITKLQERSFQILQYKILLHK